MMTDPILTKRGDTFKFDMSWTQSNGESVDLTGSLLRCQVRNRKTRTLIASASTTDGRIMIKPNGLCSVIIPASVMNQAEIGIHSMDIEITYSDGSVQSTDTFMLQIVEDITHD